ncbi:hypothetical protein ACUUL3_01535 [Thiovibrio sp. JS02]
MAGNVLQIFWRTALAGWCFLFFWRTISAFGGQKTPPVPSPSFFIIVPGTQMNLTHGFSVITVVLIFQYA